MEMTHEKLFHFASVSFCDSKRSRIVAISALSILLNKLQMKNHIFSRFIILITLTKLLLCEFNELHQ